MGIIGEFQKFAMRGNVIDMAVGIIIGAAFGKIVSSMVNDIIMPPIGLLIGGVDFADLAITIQEAGLEQAAVQIKYGVFLNTLLDFIIIAFAIFMVIKAMNSAQERLKRKEEAAAPAAAPPELSMDQKLLAEIRDLLKSQQE